MVLALAPSFLRAICSIPSFGNSEIRRERLFPDTNKNTNKTDPCREFLRVFSMRREKIRIRTSVINYCYYLSFQIGAPGRQSLSTITT